MIDDHCGSLIPSPRLKARTIRFLAGCRFFDDAARWPSASQRALRIAAANPYLLLRVVPLLTPRTPLELPAGDAAGEPVWFFLWLAAAEFAWASGNIDAVRHHLETLDAAPVISRLHCSTWRRELLRARLSDNEKNHEQAAAHLRVASGIAGELDDHRALREIKKIESELLSRPAAATPFPSSPYVFPEVPIDVQDGVLRVGLQAVVTPVANMLAISAADLYAPPLPDLLVNPQVLADEISRILEVIPGAATLPRLDLRISAPALCAVPWELAFDPTQRITRSAIDSYVIDIPLAPPEPVRVMILQADAEAERYTKRGYGLAGMRVADFYSKEGAKVDTASIDDDSWMFRMQKLEPNVIHVASGYWDSQQPREALLDMASDRSKPVSASTLAGVLERFGHLERRPVVILDALWDPFDGARQVLLRNCFAGQLWEASPIRAVLATGAYNEMNLDRMAQALRLIAQAVTHGTTLNDLHRELWLKTGSFLPPALFTNHPDARII